MWFELKLIDKENRRVRLAGNAKMFTVLNLKLIRDIKKIKGQVTAISLVMAAGIAVFIIMFGVLDSLKLTKETYYERYQFADIFASLKRAPELVKQRINEIPGVSMSETRVVFGVTLRMPGLDEPASGKIISLPDGHLERLNSLYLRSGRRLFANEDNGILVDERFYKAHQLELGDDISVIINGHLRQLKIVGVVLSPEYVYSIAPGALMPDSKRYGIFWMSRRTLEAAVNMKGAFNDIALKVSRSADTNKIQQQVDDILKPYGGLLSYTRDEQLSNFFVENELKQLQSMGIIAPIIFLSVAAFLVNVVMSRQIATEREQIGMLKAVGYHNIEILWHYLKMALLISILGILLGLLGGSWLASGMTKIYAEFFHFPILKYHFSASVMIFSVAYCFVAATSGALIAVRSVVKLPPAEAMRPAIPSEFKPSFLERAGLHKQLSFMSRMILRQLERRPIRAGFSVLGLALSLAILIFSFFMQDSMQHLINVQYDIVQREDMSVRFVDAKPYQSIEEIGALAGVLMVEPIRDVAAKLKFRHYQKKVSISGVLPESELRQIVNEQLMPEPLPLDGVIINRKLADILHLTVGDVVEAEILNEKRKVIQLVVNAIVPEYIGMNVFINLNKLNQALDEMPKINVVSIKLDPLYNATIYQKLKQNPAIVGINIVSVLRKIFKDIMAENLFKMVFINILFAGFICFGVVYNTARIALSERGRELASLRVLGLTRKEVAYLLFGELAGITLLSIPVGIFIGKKLVYGMATAMDSELFRIPAYIENNTFGYAVLIILISTMLSFYLVWRQVDAIDLVSAQKGAE